MVRFIKYTLTAALAVLLGGVLLLGPAFLGYVRTSATSIRESVQETVPIEFELRRAKGMIEGILPELQAQVRIIAQEEVEIETLKSEIAAQADSLGREEQQLAQIRDKLRTQLVSFESQGRSWTRSQVTEQLARRLDRYKTAKLSLESKERLLEKRDQSLSAAMVALDSMRHRKAELEQKVEALAAQSRLIEASRIDAGLPASGSELSAADELLEQIETRLAVAERVLDHEQDLFETIELDDEVSEQQILADYDDLFSNEQYVSAASE